MRTIQLTGPGPLWDAVYRELIVPYFPPDELNPSDTMVAGIVDGSSDATIVLDDSDAPIATAIGKWDEVNRVQLLSYLVVLQTQRRQSIGGPLLDRVLEQWRRRYEPCLILAEVEHPAAHHDSDEYGHPTARLRFYERHGAKAVDAPYFQPALTEGSNRYYGMVLLALHVSDSFSGNNPQTVLAEPLHGFMTTYLRSCEGVIGDDTATVALLNALSLSDGVPLLSLHDPDELPISVG